jgi:low affinity Fe/Cu permease
MPTDVSPQLSWFDRFAGAAALVASRATFFAFCVLLVLLWLPSWFPLQDLNLWQLVINTLTTIITFLMVALLQNSQTRNDLATQHKLNAIADGLADLMAHMAHGGDRDLDKDLTELRAAVGLEEHESTTDNEMANH